MLRHYQRLVIFHGSIVIIVGLCIGFLLTFKLLGRAQLWPLPGFAIDLPGTPGAWTAAHIGPIFNGLLAYGGAWVLSVVPLKPGELRFAAYGLVATVWANLAFYVFSIFGKARGLTGGGTTPYGDANVFDFLAYVPAALIALVTIAVVALLARSAWRGLREE